MEKVAGTDDPDAVKDMQAFIDAFSPVLAEAHKFLVGAYTGTYALHLERSTQGSAHSLQNKHRACNPA
jgi:hypothetical protein